MYFFNSFPFISLVLVKFKQRSIRMRRDGGNLFFFFYFNYKNDDLNDFT